MFSAVLEKRCLRKQFEAENRTNTSLLLITKETNVTAQAKEHELVNKRGAPPLLLPHKRHIRISATRMRTW